MPSDAWSNFGLRVDLSVDLSVGPNVDSNANLNVDLNADSDVDLNADSRQSAARVIQKDWERRMIIVSSRMLNRD